MSVVPKDVVGRIEFAENHVTTWTANSVAMGSSASAVTDWTAKVTACRAAYVAQQAAQSAAKDATTDLNVAMQAMLDATASIIKQVRAKADLVGNSVYSLASLPVPATPSPKGAPGEPTSFGVQLANNGALTLTWLCPNPVGTSGTSYMVWRRIGADNLTFLGATGEKKFIDATIPAGTVSATYQIQGFRSTAAGPWAQFNVNFTTEIGGSMSAAVAPATPKIAA